jgi:uncharacterized membrane protein SpoIIM required for sporulation
MNVERWVAKRRPIWQELEDLLRKIDRSGLSALNREQLQALGRLYRSASSDLSRARALNLGTDILSYLNNLAVKAHNQVYQSKKNRWLDFFNFLYATFPALVRRYIGYIGLSFAICVLPGIACYDFTHRDVNFAHMEIMTGRPLVSDEMWDMIEHKKMWTDQLQDASPTFSSLIAANNIRVCIMSFALGITAGLGTVIILFFNGMSIGTIFGICQHYGLLQNILLFVVGHGSLELPAIFISGGAGLLLGKAILFPGQYSRADSLRLLARPALGLFAGCIPLLLLAGCIEGFISPRTDLAGETKVLVGVAAFVALLIYLFMPRQPLGAKGN